MTRSLLLLAVPVALSACAPGFVETLTADQQALLAGGYTTWDRADRRPPRAMSAEGAEMLAVLEAETPPETRMLLTRDPALDLVAAVRAGMYRDGGRRPSSPLAQWMAWRAGAVGAVGEAVLWSEGGPVDGETRRKIVKAMIFRLIDLVREPAHFGVAEVGVGSGPRGWAIVLSQPPVELEDLPKRLTAGQGVVLRVKARRALAGGEVRVVGPSSTMVVPLLTSSDGSLSASLVAPPAAGRYVLEVTARSSRAPGEPPMPEALLGVPIYVDVAEPDAPPPAVKPAAR